MIPRCRSACEVKCPSLWVPGSPGVLCGGAGSEAVLHAVGGDAHRRLPGAAV